jgi:thiosulfate/3-mercaptopyruvate sulfurtransferase
MLMQKLKPSTYLQSVLLSVSRRSASSSPTSGSTPSKVLIETHELETLIKEQPESLAIFNATYTMQNINPREEHIKSRIPTSIFYDFNEFSDKKTSISYMVPPESQFREQMRQLNVRKSDTIVVYDKIGMISAPRAFWLFKTFGISNVMILNGAFNKWAGESRAIESGDNESAWKKIRKTEASPDDFNFSFDNNRLRKYEEIVNIAKEKTYPILDTRGASMYQQGHIPSSLNAPFNLFLNEDKTFKQPAEIKKILEDLGI